MYIQNRHNLKIALKMYGSDSATKLIFITHSLSGSKDQPHIIALARLFADNGYKVITFDTTHPLGNSEGDLRYITATSCIQDLEDVVKWASAQPWYREPFALSGHSLGGLASIIFAAKAPRQVAELYLISPAISGQWWLKTLNPYITEAWKQSGAIHKATKTGRSGYINWGFVEDFKTYDAHQQAINITMPTILTVGALDDTTPPDMVTSFYNSLSCSKELSIVKGVFHTPYEAIQALYAPIHKYLQRKE